MRFMGTCSIFGMAACSIPHVLELGKTPSFSFRQEHLLKEVNTEVVEKDLRNYIVWRDQHRATLEEGGQPSLHVLTSSERARAEPKLEAGDVSVVEIAVGARPFGPRLGSLVHVVLATIPLDGSAEQICASAQLHGRILGAPAEEIDAAVTTVAAALEHPLMEVLGRPLDEVPVIAKSPSPCAKKTALLSKA